MIRHVQTLRAFGGSSEAPVAPNGLRSTNLLLRAAGRWSAGRDLVERLQRLPWQRLRHQCRLLAGLVAAIFTPGLIFFNSALLQRGLAGPGDPFDGVIAIAYFTVTPVLIFATLVLIVYRSLGWTHWLPFVVAGAITSEIAVALLPSVAGLVMWLFAGLSGIGIPEAVLFALGFPLYMTLPLIYLWLFPLQVMALGAASGLTLWAVLHGRWPIQLLLAVVLVLPVLLVTWIRSPV